MPKSKRAKVVHLSKTPKKRKELSQRMYTNIQDCIPKYPYLYVLSVENMRNNYLKDVRAELSDSRLIFGKTKVAALALSTSPHFGPFLPLIKGATGLLFSPRPPSQIKSFFSAFHPTSFARAGMIAPLTFVLPPGALYATGGQIVPEEDVLLAHTLEPMLRKLGVPTQLVKGKVMLENEEGYVVCREGEVLVAAQTALLKAFGVEASLFGVRILGWWEEGPGCHLEHEADSHDQLNMADGVQDAIGTNAGMEMDDEGSGVEADQPAHDSADKNYS